MANIIIPDGGNIGSTSDTDALTITNTGVVKASQSIATSTIKDATGTNNSISIATNGDLTLAENAYLGSGKGIYFDGQTTSANFLDDYEDGSFSITELSTNTAGALTSGNLGHTGSFIKIGRFYHIEGSIVPTGNYYSTYLVFTVPFGINMNVSSNNNIMTSGRNNNNGNVLNVRIQYISSTTSYIVIDTIISNTNHKLSYGIQFIGAN